MEMKKSSSRKKGRQPNHEAREFFKYLYKFLNERKFQHIIDWTDEKKKEFYIKYIDVRKSRNFLQLFKAMDSISPEKAEKYQKRPTFETETKKRFKSNITKLCIDKCIEEIKYPKSAENLKGTKKVPRKSTLQFRTYYYKFLKIPEPCNNESMKNRNFSFDTSSNSDSEDKSSSVALYAYSVDEVHTPFTFEAKATKSVYPPVTSVPNAMESVYTPVPNAMENVYTPVPSAMESVYTPVPSAMESVYTPVPGAMESVYTSVANTMESVYTSVPNAIEKVYLPVTSVPNAVESIYVISVPEVMESADPLVTSVPNTMESAHPLATSEPYIIEEQPIIFHKAVDVEMFPLKDTNDITTSDFSSGSQMELEDNSTKDWEKTDISQFEKYLFTRADSRDISVTYEETLSKDLLIKGNDPMWSQADINLEASLYD